jgi:hypothetical protein
VVDENEFFTAMMNEREKSEPAKARTARNEAGRPAQEWMS